MEAVLSPQGYNLISVTSGTEALKQLLKENFAAIILDVQMPELDGFETARLIKSREKTRHIPIIFITALNQAAHYVARAYSVGAFDYIIKPFHPDLLRWKIEALVKLHKNYNQLNEQSRLLEQRSLELEKAYEKLNYTNTNLEKLVESRTAELVAINQELKQEIDEHLITQERFFKIFNLSPNLIAIRSPKNGRYVDVNQSWLKNTGYDLGDLENLGKQEFFHPIDSEVGVGGKQIMLELKESIINRRVSFLTKSGEVRYGLLSTESLHIQGEDCLMSVVTDITEQLNLELELTRLDRLKLVGVMAASICHEIRNPMTTVRGFMQILGQKREYATDEGIFKLMIEEIDRANEIITNYLSLAGNKEIISKPVSLNLIINKLYPIINSDALMTDKSLILQLDEVPFLLLDEKEICQLIMNLTRNGIEAMSPGGLLTIRTRLCQSEVWLEVADQGKGISQELLDKLGTPFLTTKDNGTGLGLAVCYSIAIRHNAKIEVESGSQGTTFRVRFNLKNNSASVWSADDLPIQRCINCQL